MPALLTRISSPPSRGRRVDGLLPIVFAGNVEVVKHRRIAAADLASGFRSALVEDVADDDPGSRLDHQPRGFGADPARRTGNQSDLAVEAVHDCPPADLGGYDQGISAAAFRPEMRPKARHSPMFPVPWYK
jgi:hypothetical protein